MTKVLAKWVEVKEEEENIRYFRAHMLSLLQSAGVGFRLSSVNKALLVASEKGQVDKVRQLITANTDVEARDEVTGTSMHTHAMHTCSGKQYSRNDHEDEQRRVEVLTRVRVGGRR